MAQFNINFMFGLAVALLFSLNISAGDLSSKDAVKNLINNLKEENRYRFQVEVNKSNWESRVLNLAIRYEENALFDLLFGIKYTDDNALDINTQDEHGATILHEAAWHGNTHAMEKILAQDCNLELRNKFGQTPIFFPARTGNKDAIKLLLKHGANPLAIDDELKTPFVRARQNGYLDAANIIIDWISARGGTRAVINSLIPRKATMRSDYYCKNHKKLSEQQLNEMAVTGRSDGLYFENTGNKVPEGNYLFYLREDGKIFFLDKKWDGTYFHCAFDNGKQSGSAGEVYVGIDRLAFTNESGHYPHSEILLNQIENLLTYQGYPWQKINLVKRTGWSEWLSTKKNSPCTIKIEAQYLFAPK